MQSILERYLKCCDDVETPSLLLNSPNEHEANRLMKCTENLTLLERNMMGDDLEGLSLKELMHLEQRIHQAIGSIHAKQGELLVQQLEELKEKVSNLKAVVNTNSNLVSKLCEIKPSCSDHTKGSTTSNLEKVHHANGMNSNVRFELCEDLNRSPMLVE